MIRIERAKELAAGIFDLVPALEIRGKSSQPLLDACRQIQSILGDPCRERAAIYREDHEQPDIWCPVDVGAKYRASEDAKGGPRFRKFQAFDSSVVKPKEAAP